MLSFTLVSFFQDERMRELLKPKGGTAAKAAAAAKAASAEGGGLPTAQSAHEQFRALPRVRWEEAGCHAILRALQAALLPRPGATLLQH